VQKPSEGVNGTYAVEPPMAKNAKGKPVNAEGKVVKRVMPTDQPRTFWYKRKGYNDFLVRILLCGKARSPSAKRCQTQSNRFSFKPSHSPWSHLMRHVLQRVASNSRATCVCCVYVHVCMYSSDNCASCFAGISQTTICQHGAS